MAKAKVPKGPDKSRRELWNFRLAAKNLHFDYTFPWRLVAAAGPAENLRATWDKVRTYFKDNFYSRPAQQPANGEIEAPKENSDGNPSGGEGN